jgi:hypothetical protein
MHALFSLSSDVLPNPRPMAEIHSFTHRRQARLRHRSRDGKEGKMAAKRGGDRDNRYLKYLHLFVCPRHVCVG